VVTLADLRDIQVELDINQNDFNRIRPDQPCTAVTDAYPDRVYECRVDEIAPEANRQKATVQVKVKILKPDDYIRPEMNARVTFLASGAHTAAPEKKLYVIPKGSVVERESGKTVFVVVDGRVQVKPIAIEREIGGEVLVSAGLAGSEAVIIGEALKQLKAGDRVETRN
jgi:HlyD family secretion protein